MRRLSFALIVTALVVPAPAGAQEWESVTSREGGFTVEMPTKPSFNRSRTRNGPGGRIKMVMLGCETAGGGYLAYKIELPTAFVRGAEDKELDSYRDFFAQEFNGRVTSEKKVRAEGRLGRDFTIRGKPEDDTGVLTIRMRTYLVGKAVYAVAVVSAPNRELPIDAGRFLGSLAIGAERKRAAGTPEPEPTGRELAGWGLAIDPGNDCEFTPQGKALTIKVPGTWHDLNPDSGKLNAPRVVHEVEGDFVISVKVEGEYKPADPCTNPRGVPYAGAGIIVWSDSDNFIRLERGAVQRKGNITPTAAFEEREGGYRGAMHNVTLKRPGPIYVRVERKGSRIFGSISADGSKWEALKPIDTVWPTKLKVGLAAISSSSQPFTVQFTDFSFEAKGK